MKKMSYFIAILLLLGVGYSVNYISSYSIKNNNESVEDSLKDWVNRGRTYQLNPTLIGIDKLDDTPTYIALFQLENGNIGYVRLKKGLNGRFKIISSSYGSNELQYEDLETNTGLYYILVGKNPEKKINTIEVELFYEDYEFNVDVSNQELFIKYHKFPKNFQQPYPAEFRMLDKDSNVIQKK